MGRIPLSRVLLAVLVAAGVAISLGPYVWTLFTSLKSEAELLRTPLTYIPENPTLQNYEAVFKQNPFGRFLLNSFIVAASSTALCIVLASLAGYAFGRLRFRGRTPLLMAVLAFSTLPVMSLIVPLYIIIQRLGLLNTYPGLIIPYVTWSLPLAVFILTNFFRQIPRDLEESAWIDGAGRLQALWHVIVPLSGPGIVSAAIIVFITVWNDFLIALTLVSSVSMRTVTVGIALYRGEYAFPWGTITAAVCLATIPIALLLMVGQRWVTSGLLRGSLKG